MPDSTAYMFKGNHYYNVPIKNKDETNPKLISTNWPGLPVDIDAALTVTERNLTYFFKDDQYWRFRSQAPDRGYPKKISVWNGLPNNLDAAFEWGRDGNLFFFKGSQFWKYDVTKHEMAEGFPRDISSKWKGVPDNIDAAFTWKNGKTYFFKDDEFWRLNNKNQKVEKANPPFPRKTGKVWVKCQPKRKTWPISEYDIPFDEDYDDNP